MQDVSDTPKKTRKPRKTAAQKLAEEGVKAEAPPLAAVPDAEPPPEDGEKVLDGVFVVKDQTPDGSIDVRVIKNGNLGVLEVESLLKLGLKRFQEQMGFS